MEQIALLVAMALGWTWVEWAWSAANWRPRWAGWLVNASLGAGVGVGVASTLYFVLVWLGIGNGWVAVGLNGVLLVAVGWMVRRRRLEERAVAGAGEWSGNGLLGLVTAALLVGAGGAVVKMSEATPHGDWDAWAIWNLKAKFLAAGGEEWKRAMSPLMRESKPDYPLLLPGAVALGWRLKGESTAAGGQAVAWVMGGAVAGLLVSAAALARTVSLGWLSGLLLVASAGYLVQIPAQYADVPLSFYILGATACLLLAERAPGLVEVGGFLAGCAAWTKNEGIVFSVLMLGAMVAVLGRRAVGRLVSGALPVLVVVGLFKVLVAGEESLRWAPLGALGEAGRWATVLGRFGEEVWNWGLGWGHPLLIAGVLVATLGWGEGTRAARWAALVLGLQAASYVLVLVLTGENVEFQAAAAPRLLGQIWPAGLLVLAAWLRAPEEAARTVSGRIRSRR